MARSVRSYGKRPLFNMLIVGYVAASVWGCRDDLSPMGASRLAPDEASTSNAWQTLPQMAAPRSHGVAIILGNCAWTIGGVNAAGTPVQTVETVCNTVPPRWTAGPNIPAPLADFAGGGVISGALYVTGGRTNVGTFSNTLWKYTTAGGWAATPDVLPDGLACGSAGVSGGKLYAFGMRAAVGIASDCSSNFDAELLVYDPGLAAPPRWRVLATPPRPHLGGAVGVVGTKLYLIGGYASGTTDPEPRVDVFDLTTEAWLPDGSLPPDMPTPRVGAGVAVSGGRLYTIGGFNSSLPYNPGNQVDVLDPGTNGWAEVRPLSDNRVFPFAVGLGNRILAAGGGWQAAQLASADFNISSVPNKFCDVYEPDDAITGATPWRITDPAGALLVGKEVTEGRICSAADVDQFLIDTRALTGGLAVELQLPANTDYQLELMDSTGTTAFVTAAAAGFAAETISVAGLPAAAYQLRVRSQNGSFDKVNAYRLRLISATPRAATVSLAPAIVTLVPQATSQPTLTTTDAFGNVFTGATGAWSSSATSIAAVDAAGTVTAIAVGQASISVRVDGLNASTTVNVVDGGVAFPAGNTILSKTGLLRLDVPPGAVSAPSIIRFVPLATVPDSLLYVRNSAYAVNGPGVTLNAPLRLTMNYSTLTLPVWAQATELEIHSLDPASSTVLPGSVVDPGTTSVRADLAVFDTVGLYSTLPRLGERARARGKFFGAAVEPIADTMYDHTVATQYGSVTAKDAMKWGFIQPDSNKFVFKPADSLITLAQAHNQRVQGHTLIWHKQLPDYIENGTWTRATLLDALKAHVMGVVGHFAGKVDSWNVVNELLEDGTFVLRPTIFYNVIGPDYVDSALVWAHQADPAAKLYLNEYNVSQAGPKITALLNLATGLRSRGIPIDGIGIQNHLTLNAPSAALLAANLHNIAAAGFDTHLSEMDVRILDTDPPTSLVSQGNVYFNAWDACLSEPRCVGITTWGVDDGTSWIMGKYPGWGRPLPFDATFAVKPAFFSIAQRLIMP